MMLNILGIRAERMRYLITCDLLKSRHFSDFINFVIFFKEEKIDID